MNHATSDITAVVHTSYTTSSPLDLPLDIFDANFLSRLVIVIVPLAFSQVDTSERGVGLDALGFEVTLQMMVSQALDEFCLLPLLAFGDSRLP